jgi:rsbT co-antagonist protein RsbR
MPRLTVGTKFVSVIVLAILLVLLAGAVGIFELQRVSDQTLQLAGSAEANQYAHALQFDLQELHRVLTEGSTRKNLEWFHQPLDQPLGRIRETTANLTLLLREQGNSVGADEIDRLHTTLINQVKALVDLAAIGDWNTAYLSLANEVEPTQALFEARIRELDQELQRNVSSATTAVRTTQQRVLQNLAIITAIALLLLGLAGWLLWRNLVKPLRSLTDTAVVLARGDLDERTTVAHRTDEVGALASAFNTMADNLAASHRNLAQQVDERTAELKAEQVALQQTLTDLQASTSEREHLLTMVEQLQNPVIPVVEGVIVAPIVGQLTRQRLNQLQGMLLHMVTASHARIVLLDITGVPMLDEQAAAGLIETGQALKLLGARPILVGISPEVAQSLVSLGTLPHHLVTALDLQNGIDLALRMLRRQIVPIDTATANGRTLPIR